MRHIALLILMISFLACAKRQSFKDLAGWNEKPEQSLELSVRWVKPKKSKTDMLVVVKNKYDFAVVISEGSIQYAVNGDEGIVKNANPRRILNPGDIAQYQLTFEFSGPQEGTGTLRLANVFSGKVIEVQGVNTKQKTNSVGSAIGNAATTVSGNRADTHGSAIAIGHSNSQANSETYQRRSFTEGELLPIASLEVPN